MRPAALRELLRLLLTTNFSSRRIARIAQLSRNTVGRCRTRVKKSCYRWEELNQLPDSELQHAFNRLTCDRSVRRAPDWPFIHELLHEKHQTRIQLWEEYRRADPGDAYCYSQLNKHPTNAGVSGSQTQ